MSDEDRYRYHAYNYGWQRAMLGRFDEHEPVDPDGDWFIANMADRAEEYQRKKVGMKPRERRAQKPSDPDAVRTNWRQIYLKDLTTAEKGLAQESRDEIMRRMRSENPRSAAKAERMIGNLSPEAPEIDAP